MLCFSRKIREKFHHYFLFAVFFFRFNFFAFEFYKNVQVTKQEVGLQSKYK